MRPSPVPRCGRSFVHVVPLLLWLLLVAGCGRGGPEVVPVRGQITRGGGPWPQPGMIYFTTVEPADGLPDRPAYAQFDAQGNFRVTSFQPDDGLVPGRYRAAVECWQSAPQMSDPTPPVSYVPARFRSPQTSGLEVTVEPGERSVSIRWDVPEQ